MSPDATQPPSPHPGHTPRPEVFPLMLAALGVVYGDIGTSPLYAIRECFHGPHAVAATRANLLGVLSLVFWSLTLIVTVRYLGFIMRADNQGEGGIFSLLALVPAEGTGVRARRAMVALALLGAALLYGDGVITPAISVLSAVEGLAVAGVGQRLIVPASCAILIGLFMAQKRGTAGVGRIFGPVMLVWFAVIAVLGLRQVFAHPQILAALNPLHAATFFVENRGRGFLVLGAVVLAFTGSEALYADMGHFGKPPLRRCWLFLVFPALLANYFGQGALLLVSPQAASNPFYALVPRTLLFPMIGLATAATIIASQAMISGAFSLTRQAIQLGYLPRMHIVHTSRDVQGQIYVPSVNTALMLACLALVVTMRESSALAAAYGIAVCGAMAITSILYYFVTTRRWGWSFFRAAPLVLSFLAIDLVFLGSNVLKFVEGGWVPVLIAALVFTLMTTWRDGRERLGGQIAGRLERVDLFLKDVATHPDIPRVKGTAVFMTSSPQMAPIALLHQFKHTPVLHERVVLLSFATADVPLVPPEGRVRAEPLGQEFYRVVASFGFMETPSVEEVLKESAARFKLDVDFRKASYFLSRETLLSTAKPGMMRWRKALFAFISRNARSPTAFFGLPPGRVVELGMQIEL